MRLEASAQMGLQLVWGADDSSSAPTGLVSRYADAEWMMPRVLLAHDGELSDVRELLDEIGAEYEERSGELRSDDHQTVWKVVVGTPRRVLELQVGAAGEKPTRMALFGGESKTLIAMLRRSGIDLMIQRPVHPAALRLLIIHALYQGPEKRRHQRVTIGTSVRYRMGMLKRSGLLADLSLRGCRLITPEGASRDKAIKIYLGTEIGAPKAFVMKGRIVRSGPTEGTDEPSHTTAVAFDQVTREEAKMLKEILVAHVTGPAVLDRTDAARVNAREMVRSVKEESIETPVMPGAPARPSRDERREEPRYTIDRRIIALGVEAARVLIGRDISLAGMRVESHELIEVGDELRLALHVRARAEPLVLQARVERDDGEEGMMLGFYGLTDAAENYLRKMVTFLPILAARGGDEGSGVIVSEILERLDAAATSVAALPTE